MLDRVQLPQPASDRRRRLARLCLLAFCGGLLPLLSSVPAEAAERRKPGLLDPVRTTLKATAREVDSFAGRATGSGSSKVGGAAGGPRPRPVPPPAVKPVTSAASDLVDRVAKPGNGSLKLGRILAPVGSVLDPVASALAPVTGPVAGLVTPVVPEGPLPRGPTVSRRSRQLRPPPGPSDPGRP